MRHTLILKRKSGGASAARTHNHKNSTVIIMQIEVIKEKIEVGLPGSFVHVEGDGAHFQAIVVFEGFAGKNRIKKQQMVYDTLREELLDGTLHALSIKTFTPEEWDAFSNSHGI